MVVKSVISMEKNDRTGPAATRGRKKLPRFLGQLAWESWLEGSIVGELMTRRGDDLDCARVR